MKKQLLGLTMFVMMICLTACSGEDDSTSETNNSTTDTTQLMGKWIIYKAQYGEGTEPLLYEFNGACGKEMLDFSTNGEVTETVYIDADCNNGGVGYYSWWVQDSGDIALGAQNSYHHTVTVNGNELILNATEEADYIKYYHRANQ